MTQRKCRNGRLITNAIEIKIYAAPIPVKRNIVPADCRVARRFSRETISLARVELVYAQIAITEKQVKLSEDNLRLSRVRYEGGEGVALDVVAAQGQLAQARANYFTAKASYLNARVDLEVAAGR